MRRVCRRSTVFKTKKSVARHTPESNTYTRKLHDSRSWSYPRDHDPTRYAACVPDQRDSDPSVNTDKQSHTHTDTARVIERDRSLTSGVSPLTIVSRTTDHTAHGHTATSMDVTDAGEPKRQESTPDFETVRLRCSVDQPFQSTECRLEHLVPYRQRVWPQANQDILDSHLMLGLHYVPGGHGNHVSGHRGQNGMDVRQRGGTGWAT